MNWRVVSPQWCIFGKRIASMLGVECSDKAEGAEAAIFIEMFPGMIEEALKYKNTPKICWWTGTDVRVYLESKDKYDFGNTAHVTDTPWLIYQLSKKIHPVCFLPMPCSLNSDEPPPYPKDPAILMYLSDHRARDVERSIEFIKFNRDIPIYVMSGPVPSVIKGFLQENVTPIGFIKDEERMDLFKKISIYIRFMHFDGMSQLVVEMKCLGRHVASTILAPYCEMMYNDDDQRLISNTIRTLIKTPPDEAGRDWYRAVFNRETFDRVIKGICDVRKWELPGSIK